MDAVVTDAKKAMADVAALVDSANFLHLQQILLSLHPYTPTK
jgi:hypothetical protein